MQRTTSNTVQHEHCEDTTQKTTCDNTAQNTLFEILHQLQLDDNYIIVKRLLAHRLLMHMRKDYNDLNILRIAATNNIASIVEMLLIIGVDDRRVCNWPANTENGRIIKLMLEMPYDPFYDIAGLTVNDARYEVSQNCSISTIVLLTVALGHIDIVRLFIKYDARNWYASIDTAARCGHIDIVQLMLDNGVSGKSSGILYNAVLGGHINIVRLALAYGTKPWNLCFESCRDDEIMELLHMHTEI